MTFDPKKPKKLKEDLLNGPSSLRRSSTDVHTVVIDKMPYSETDPVWSTCMTLGSRRKVVTGGLINPQPKQRITFDSIDFSINNSLKSEEVKSIVNSKNIRSIKCEKSVIEMGKSNLNCDMQRHLYVAQIPTSE